MQESKDRRDRQNFKNGIQGSADRRIRFFSFFELQKAQIARKAAEKIAVGNILGDSSENVQNDDMSWYFNRSYDDPLDRLEGYENEVQQENLYF